MKSAILIAYYFPPEGNAAAYRPLRFARHLPRLEWQVSVVSCLPPSYDRYDPDLLSQLPPNVEVMRVPIRDPWLALQAKRGARIQKRMSRGSAEELQNLRAAHEAPSRAVARSLVRSVEAWCYHPDAAMAWIRPAVQAVVQASSRLRPKVIWATAGPVSCFRVAFLASRQTGVPYVLDFRDGWTITHNDFEAQRPAWARRADRRSMYRMLEGAQAVVFLYESVAECFMGVYGGALPSSKIHIIPNGFDGRIEEFTAPAASDRCVIAYTGTLSSYEYGAFFKALRQFKDDDRAAASKLRVLFVGEGMEAVAQEASQLQLSDIVETTGHKTQQEVLRLQQEAHAMLIFGRPGSMKGHELFAGAKLFGYLRAGRPIVGVLPSDETRRILREVGIRTLADVDSASEIVSVLKDLLNAWSSQQLASLVPDPTACAAFSAEGQTAALDRALQGVSADQSFSPGRVQVPASLRQDIDASRNLWPSFSADQSS
jgi:hypothetical protein